MKRILLISPPATGLKDKLAYPPLGIMYLASNFETEHEIKLLNMVNQDELHEFDFDIFGITIHSVSSYIPAKELSVQIRKKKPESLVVMGGSFPTSMVEYTLENTEADIVVIGEGEKIFSNICKFINSRDSERLKEIKGIAYKYNGKIFKNSMEELIKDLNTIKFPARHLLPRDMIRHEGKVHHNDEPATTIFATRGCAYKCAFCDTSVWRQKWRSRSHENIIQEILFLKKEYDIHWIRFPDDCITLNRKWFKQFCEKIKECNIRWTVLSRADTIDPDLLKLMKDTGCMEIFFGFESGSQRLLDMMNKRIKVEDNVNAIKMCRDAGIASCAYMMFGFPGEDEKTVEETKEFLIKTRPDKSRISTFIPIPGTDVWNNPEKYKVRIKNNFTDYWYFDCPEFGLEYNYIGNDKMAQLRKDMMDFYKDQGFLQDWEKPKLQTVEIGTT